VSIRQRGFWFLGNLFSAAQLQVLMLASKIPAAVAARLSCMAVGTIRLLKAMGIVDRQGKIPTPVLHVFGLTGQCQIGDAWRHQIVAVAQPALWFEFDDDGHGTPTLSANRLKFNEGESLVTR